jgi:hypothetical protein
MESSERRDFVVWLEACGDAVQIAKDQVQTITMVGYWMSTPFRQAWTSFPRQLRQNPHTTRCIALVVIPR